LARVDIEVQCPSICGETCPEGYCQACAQYIAARVDLLELKDYGNIDPAR
jgi:hypothetical protein